MGFDKCNTLVVGLLREALVAQGWAALGRLSAAERRGSERLFNMGMLLQDMGKPEEARLLCEEMLQGDRETRGDRDPGTLASIGLLADLLEKQGKLVEAIPLFTEVLEAYVLRYGMERWETSVHAKLLVSNLRKVGQLEEAEALADKHGLAEQLQASKETVRANRETLGDRHEDTLFAISNLAMLLEKQGKLVEAIPLYTEALEGYVLLLGMEHATTSRYAKRLVSKLRKVGQQEEAEALADKHGLASN